MAPQSMLFLLLLLFLVATATQGRFATAFRSVPFIAKKRYSQQATYCQRRLRTNNIPTKRRVSSFILFAVPPAAEDNGIDDETNNLKQQQQLQPAALPSSSTDTLKDEKVDDETDPAQPKIPMLPTALPASSTSDATTSEGDDSPPPTEAASVSVMINQSTRRILIEELGYRRADVDRMRPELAGPIVDKRLRCPIATEPNWTMPDDWCVEVVLENNEPNQMLRRLQDESKYPLKTPLLGISLVLVGKGFSDALITLIKVNTGFPGASLTELFLGVPVLAIDLLCVIVGIALGSWTWNTMQDKR